jgi:hypothetical protein
MPRSRCAQASEQPRGRLAAGLLLVGLLLVPLRVECADRALTLYAGRYSDDRLTSALLSKSLDYMDSHLVVAAVSRAFEFDSPSHQWELEGQVGKHFGDQTHWELNGLAIYRWQRFPWNRLVRTTVAAGEGLSWATRVPPLEEASPTNEGAARLLNYILVEVTVAPPGDSDWSLVFRIHHRSGVFGLFEDVDGGSNIIAGGVKWRF